MDVHSINHKDLTVYKYNQGYNYLSSLEPSETKKKNIEMIVCMIIIHLLFM